MSRRAARSGSVRRRSWRGRRRVLFGVVAVLIGGAVGVGLYLAAGLRVVPSTGNPSAGPTPGANVPTGALPGQLAPDFAIRTSTGQDFRLSDHLGEVVVLDFLAPG